MENYGETSLYELIKMAQLGDRNCVLELINKFKPLIKKLIRRLNYEEAETDLIILFIQLIQTLNLNKFTRLSEGALVKYIYNSLTNRCIDLFRKYVLKKTEELELNLDTLQTEIDMDADMFINELLNLNILTEQQKLILKKFYISEYSDSEIAKMLNISRQAVNKTKNRGIKTLRTYLGQNFIARG